MFDAKNCPFLPQETQFTAFLSRMSREYQHTRFEDQILGQVSLWGRPASCASLIYDAPKFKWIYQIHPGHWNPNLRPPNWEDGDDIYIVSLTWELPSPNIFFFSFSHALGVLWLNISVSLTKLLSQKIVEISFQWMACINIISFTSTQYLHYLLLPPSQNNFF